MIYIQNIRPRDEELLWEIYCDDIDMLLFPAPHLLLVIIMHIAQGTIYKQWLVISYSRILILYIPLLARLRCIHEMKNSCQRLHNLFIHLFKAKTSWLSLRSWSLFEKFEVVFHLPKNWGILPCTCTSSILSFPAAILTKYSYCYSQAKAGDGTELGNKMRTMMKI